jgi:hypothetical protein
MALHDVTDLVTQRGGKLGFVVEQGKQAACHHDVPSGGMGIGQGLVQHDEAVMARDTRLPHQFLADTIDIGLQCGVWIGRTDIALEFARQGRDADTGLVRRCLRLIVLHRTGGGGEQREKNEYPAENH